MSSGILFEQLLVLLGFMITGIISAKANWIDDHAYGKISSLMVWVFNPAIMISGVIGKNVSISGEVIWQNIIAVSLLYFAFFLIGWVYIFLMRYKKEKAYLYRFVTLFPNVGFMGIPLVKEVFGAEYLVFVAFYMLFFNVICYSYGIHLAARMGGNTEKFQFRKLISPGSMTSIIAILIFALHLDVPAPIENFVTYLGNTCIPLSMIMVGVSLTKTDWKSSFRRLDYYAFLIAKMVVIPMILVYLFRLLPFDKVVIGVVQIMACMPVATMTCMFAQEYAGDGDECAKLIALTTVFCVLSVPFVIYVAG